MIYLLRYPLSIVIAQISDKSINRMNAPKFYVDYSIYESDPILIHKIHEYSECAEAVRGVADYSIYESHPIHIHKSITAVCFDLF